MIKGLFTSCATSKKASPSRYTSLACSLKPAGNLMLLPRSTIRTTRQESSTALLRQCLLTARCILRQSGNVLNTSPSAPIHTTTHRLPPPEAEIRMICPRRGFPDALTCSFTASFSCMAFRERSAEFSPAAHPRYKMPAAPARKMHTIAPPALFLLPNTARKGISQ